MPIPETFINFEKTELPIPEAFTTLEMPGASIPEAFMDSERLWAPNLESCFTFEMRSVDLRWPRKSPGADRSQTKNLDVGG